MKQSHELRPPPLAMTEQDGELLRELAETLAVHNIQQYNALIMTKDGFADSSRWKELRRKEGVRIYRERARHDGCPTTPSLLLLGTVDGTLEDVMYGTVTTTEEQIRVKSTCTQDGVVDSKVLHNLVTPTVEDPFHHVSIKWRLYNNARDYVSLDTTGIAHTVKRERIGYNISHSVAFAQIPGFESSHNVERGNMSVCSLFKQKTASSVEIYVRGFFDFHTQNEMVNTMSLQAIATQWASYARKRQCSRMKKLVWRMRKNSGCTTRLSLYDERLSLSATQQQQQQQQQQQEQKKAAHPNRCPVCSKSFGFLGTKYKTCKSCMRQVSTRCCSKQLVCVVAPDQRTVLEKKRSFCAPCLAEVDKSDALAVAREELQSSTAFHEECVAQAEEMARSSTANFTQSAVSRRSRITARSQIGRDSAGI